MSARKIARLKAIHRKMCEGCKFDNRNVFMGTGCQYLWDIEYNQRLRRYECATKEEKREQNRD
jgi:hypothetical protein